MEKTTTENKIRIPQAFNNCVYALEQAQSKGAFTLAESSTILDSILSLQEHVQEIIKKEQEELMKQKQLQEQDNLMKQKQENIVEQANKERNVQTITL